MREPSLRFQVSDSSPKMMCVVGVSDNQLITQATGRSRAACNIDCGVSAHAGAVGHIYEGHPINFAPRPPR